MADADTLTATPRLFTAADLKAGEEVAATASQAHHLGGVLRRAPGDTVRVFNGRDGEWAASILSLRRDRALFAPHTRLRAQDDPPTLLLVFAVLKRDATDLIVQKATELGATELKPMFTARTVAQRVNEDRLRAIATEAAEQSERLTVPSIAEPVTLQALLAAWPADRILAAAIERGAPCPVPDASALLVGPEGGFTGGEIRLLHTAGCVRPIWLGPQVLRAETAAMTGLALLQARGWGIY